MAAWLRGPVIHTDSEGQQVWFSYRPSARPAWSYRRVNYRWTVQLRLHTPAGQRQFSACFTDTQFPAMAACLRYLEQTPPLFEAFLPLLEPDWTAEVEPELIFRDVGVMVVTNADG